MKRDVASGSLSTSCTSTARLLLAVLGSLMASSRATSALSASVCEGHVTSTVMLTADCSWRRAEAVACGRGGAAEAEEKRRRRAVLTVMETAVASTVRLAALRIASTALRSVTSLWAS